MLIFRCGLKDAQDIRSTVRLLHLHVLGGSAWASFVNDIKVTAFAANVYSGRGDLHAFTFACLGQQTIASKCNSCLPIDPPLLKLESTTR